MNIKPREEVARFIEDQFINDTTREKGHKHHYGQQELRDLLDFLYGGPPENADQELFCKIKR